MSSASSTTRSAPTEGAYVNWVKRFILFHGKRHLQELGVKEVEAFLTDLAIIGVPSPARQSLS